MRSLTIIVSLISVMVFTSTVVLHFRTREAADTILLSRALDKANTFALAAKAAPLDDGILSRMSANMIDETVLFACIYKPDATHLCRDHASHVLSTRTPEMINRVIRQKSYVFDTSSDESGKSVFELWFPVSPGPAAQTTISSSKFGPGPKEEGLRIVLLQLDTASADQLVAQSTVNFILVTLLLGTLIALTSRQLRLIARDREREREMSRQRRYVEIGRLSAVLAHEIRNPLGAIKGFAQFTTKHFEPGTPEREDMDTIVYESTRLERLVKALLLYAKPQETNVQPFSLTTMLRRLTRLVDYDARQKSVEIKLHFNKLNGRNDEEIIISADEEQLMQALLNLVVNGIDAMEDGGKLELQLAEDEHQVRIIVRDEGIGIDNDDLGEIFEPYFTNKASGTGLGLAVAKRIVEAHKGHIQVDTSVGAGTCFTVSLPKKEHAVEYP